MRKTGGASIVKWAEPNEWIPLRCTVCGAIFATRNLKHVGYTDIHLGHTLTDEYPFQASQKCTHGVGRLKPDLNTYEGGIW